LSKTRPNRSKSGFFFYKDYPAAAETNWLGFTALAAAASRCMYQKSASLQILCVQMHERT
jgi:hypothetical protein